MNIKKKQFYLLILYRLKKNCMKLKQLIFMVNRLIFSNEKLDFTK